MNNTIIEWGCLSIKPSRKRRKLKSTFTTTNEQKEKASLILGSGDTFYTAVASFRFRETVALIAPDFAGDRLRESGGSDRTVLSPASSPI
ncbi:hypothetical protein YC2023_119870 [Brassica napus]